ncbi:glycosyltransferase [Mariniflexile sp.]|uniref:glycosyltransferase n=1 Tax=Mariniflexile sp. TaxID=1979402 RepID=UPI00356A6803
MKILFITHETTRTGAPKVLLLFLQWLYKNTPSIEVDVVTLKGGQLTDAFKKNCTHFYDYSLATQPTKLSIAQRLLLKLKLYKRPNLKERFIENLANNHYNVIYANTVVSIPLAVAISKKNSLAKVVAHMHELPAIINLSLPNFESYITSISQFIVPSHLVKANLVQHWSVDENNIKVVYECSEVENLLKEKKVNTVFTVGASGYVHWRKGHDVFVQLARYVTKNYPNCKMQFVWVGTLPKTEEIILQEDLKKLGLDGIIKFVGEVDNPASYYNNFDVFVMTSREDPFPLVCIEVGMLGKPIVSFENAVGTNEILAEAGGYIVPYLDIELMAEKIVSYYNSPGLKVQHGALNREAFSKFTPDIICPQLLEAVSNI